MLIDPRTAATGHLRAGESLLWSGQPDTSAWFAPGDAFLVPFSIAWLAFVIFWESSAASSAAPPFFPVFGAVFIIVGLYYAVGRFFVKQWRKRSTVYAVTTKRAFVLSGRTLRETPIANASRTTSWSRSKRVVSVVWSTGDSGRGGLFRTQNGMPVNTGFDGFLGPVPMAFFDVSDSSGMLRALEHADAMGQPERH